MGCEDLVVGFVEIKVFQLCIFEGFELLGFFFVFSGFLVLRIQVLFYEIFQEKGLGVCIFNRYQMIVEGQKCLGDCCSFNLLLYVFVLIVFLSRGSFYLELK